MQTSKAAILSRILLACLIAIGLTVGTFAAYYVHHAGRGWVAALFIGIIGGGVGILSALLFLFAVLRIIWLVRFVRRTNDEE